ncbi:MAG: acyltransferase [Thermoleophilaceae bacterium]|nr:acyltransferase [Thermoleophilaceae bacterium]
MALLSSADTAPAAVTPPPGHPRFPLIDGLRAIAAISILVTHASFITNASQLAFYGKFTARLEVGVAIFFVISGFLLYRPFVSSRVDGARRPGYVEYGKRRVLRIVPAYWLALTVLSLYPGLPSMWSDHSWAYYLFGQIYVSEWFLGGLGQTWSLAVEASWYLLLPFLAMLALRLPGRDRTGKLRSEWALVAALAAFGIGFRAWAFETQGGGSVLLSTLPSTLAWFAFGMAIAVASVSLHQRAREPAAVSILGRFPLAAWIAAALMFWFVSTQLNLPVGFQAPGRLIEAISAHVLYGLIGVALLLPAVFTGAGGGIPRRILGNRVLAWLGLISYGIFLWHYPINQRMALGRAHDLWGDYQMLGVTLSTLAITVVCAAGSYYALERPLLRLKYRRRR